VLEVSEPGITLNDVAPGMVRTPFDQQAIDDPDFLEEQVQSIPLKRAAQPAEIGRLAVFLASREADHVTGAAYVMDGGLMQMAGQGPDVGGNPRTSATPAAGGRTTGRSTWKPCGLPWRRASVTGCRGVAEARGPARQPDRAGTVLASEVPEVGLHGLESLAGGDQDGIPHR
jgi:hypothetical protein